MLPQWCSPSPPATAGTRCLAKDSRSCVQLQGRKQTSAKAALVVVYQGSLRDLHTLSRVGVPRLCMQIHTNYQHYTQHTTILANCHISFLVFFFRLKEQVFASFNPNNSRNKQRKYQLKGILLKKHILHRNKYSEVCSLGVVMLKNV